MTTAEVCRLPDKNSHLLSRSHGLLFGLSTVADSFKFGLRSFVASGPMQTHGGIFAGSFAPAKGNFAILRDLDSTPREGIGRLVMTQPRRSQEYVNA